MDPELRTHITFLAGRTCAPLPTTSTMLCELCHAVRARFILKNSLLLCCSSFATRCKKIDLSKAICYGCGRPAKLVQACGPVCGDSKGQVRCSIAAQKLRENSGKVLSAKCKNTDFRKKRSERFQATMKLRYGVTHAFHSKEFIQKSQATIKERYNLTPSEFQKQAAEKGKQKFQLANPGFSHWTQQESTKKAYRDTSIKNFGVDNVMKKPEVISQRRKRWQAKYGVGHPMQVEELSQQRFKTWKDNHPGIIFGSKEWWDEYKQEFQNKHGVFNPQSLPRRISSWKNSNIESLGFPIPMQSPAVRAKQENCMLQRYHVKNAMHSPDLFSKAKASSFKTKKMTLPSGRVVDFQGYEDKAITWHLKSIAESDIEFETTRSFSYKDQAGKDRKYYPDLVLPGVVVEVKSVYTFLLEPDFRLIAGAVELAGLKFIVEVWDEQGTEPLEIFQGEYFHDDSLFEFLKTVDSNCYYSEPDVIHIPSQNLSLVFLKLKQSQEQFLSKQAYKRFLSLQSRGIRALFVFEDEWLFKRKVIEDMILSFFKRSQKRCSPEFFLEESASVKSLKFLEQYHYLGGNIRGIAIRAGFGGETIGVWIFQKCGRGVVNWARACWNHNFKAWNPHEKALNLVSKKLRELGTEEIITFADNRFHTGKLYSDLGFIKTHDLPPSYLYTDGVQRRHKFQFRVPAGVDENALANQLGWHRIWDVGKQKFVKILEQFPAHTNTR